MAPATLPKLEDVQLTVPDIQDRLIGLDTELARTMREYADAAEAAKLATRSREVALAEAADAAEGSPTEKRWAALVIVGSTGLAEEARFARLKAEVDVLSDRIMANASLLKSAGRGQGDIGRYDEP